MFKAQTSRRFFIKKGMQYAGGLATLTILLHCENGTSSSGQGEGSCEISGNHGHGCLDLDINSQNDITVTLNGGHTHNFSLTTQELANIRGGQSVSKISTTSNGHSHQVTVKK